MKLQRRVKKLLAKYDHPAVLTDPILDGFIDAYEVFDNIAETKAYIDAANAAGRLPKLVIAADAAGWLPKLVDAADATRRLRALVDAADNVGRLRALVIEANAAGLLQELVGAADDDQMRKICDAAGVVCFSRKECCKMFGILSPQTVSMRWMLRRDLPEVMAIEAESFGYPWTEAELLQILQQRNCLGLVAEIGRRVAGFVVYEMAADHIYIHNLAVAMSRRGQGAGTALIGETIKKLGARRRIVACASEYNLEAQLFFRAVGFRATEILRNYYDGRYDAYQFTYGDRIWDARKPVSTI